jgi:tetratricopeptide (TPR) repeat protein
MSALALHDHLIEACQLFEHLSSLSKLSAQSWFHYSEWLTSLSKFREAYDALEQTLRLDPQNNEARLSLSALQRQIGMHEQSQHTLAEVVSRPIKQEYNEHHDASHEQHADGTSVGGDDDDDNDDEQQEVTVEKIHLLVERCMTIYDQNQLTLFIPCAMQLFFGSMKYLLTLDCSKRLINCGTRARRLELIQKLVDDKRIILNTSYTRINTVLKNRIIDLYGKFCDVLIHIKRHDLLLRVTAAGTVIPFLYARIDW